MTLSRPHMVRQCKRCDKVLRRDNVTGFCIKHHNSDPAVKARRAKTISATRRRKEANDPEFRAKSAAHGKWLSQNFNGNDSISAEERKRIGRKLTERYLGWCPPDLRDDYRRLVRNMRYTAAEARTMIEEYMEKRMTPFERAMERVRRGAGIFTVPDLRAPAPAYTLGGVSPEIL